MLAIAVASSSSEALLDMFAGAALLSADSEALLGVVFAGAQTAGFVQRFRIQLVCRLTVSHLSSSFCS